MKLIKNLFLSALAVLAFNACDDVPEPYTPPGGGPAPVLGENLLSNSDFEVWSNNKPIDWAAGVTNADIEQSTDAVSGTSSVLIKGYSSSNKRFASKSYFLLPGTYTLSAFLKQTGETAGQYRLGYAKLTNGIVADTQNDYIYITDAAPVSTTWNESKAQFKVEEETEVSLIVMNSKYGEGASILVDSVTLRTSDGGLADGDTPSSPINPDEISNISDVIAAGAGEAKVQGTIIATYARGFIVNDNTGSILVYLGEDKGHAVGDVVIVSGSTSMFANMLQFGNSSTVEKTGTANVETPEPVVMSAADMDAYLGAPVLKYVQYTGTLNISGYYYNVNIDGATTAIGSIAYPHDGMVDESLNGKKITVTGYTIGVNQGKYVNTMAVSVVAAEGEDTTTPDEPGTPDTPDTPTGEAIVFDFTNPTALTPSITPAQVEAGATSGKGVEMSEVTFTNGNVSIKLSQDGASTPVRIWTKTGGDVELRTYNKSTITISGSNMTSIEFAGGKVSTMTADTGTFSAGKWSGNADTVTFSVSGTLNIQSITVK